MDRKLISAILFAFTLTCHAGSVADYDHEEFSQEQFDTFNVLRLDCDDQNEQAEDLGAWRQSTLILYAHGEEVDRSLGETDPREIAKFLGQIISCK